MAKQDYHWPFLDLVRFSAALLVMFGHFRGFFFESITKVEGAGPITKAFYVLTGIHHEGVILFFVVSGFLIGGRVWDLMEQNRFSPSNYFIDRFSRIFIVLIPGLLLSGVIDWLGTSYLSDTRFFGVRPLEPAGITSGWMWAQVPCHLASLQSLACSPLGVNPPLWSLGFEWTFYFLAPLMLGALYAPVHIFARIAILGMIAAGLMTLFGGVGTFMPMLAVWFLGAVSARVMSRSNLPLVLGILGLVLAAACMVLSRAKSVPLAATDTGIAVGLALALAGRPIVQLRVAEAWVRRGAAFSFSLYLLHVPLGLLIGAALERLGWPRDLAPPGMAAYSAFGLTVGLTMIAARAFAALTEEKTSVARRLLRGVATQTRSPVPKSLPASTELPRVASGAALPQVHSASGPA